MERMIWAVRNFWFEDLIRKKFVDQNCTYKFLHLHQGVKVVFARNVFIFIFFKNEKNKKCKIIKNDIYKSISNINHLQMINDKFKFTSCVYKTNNKIYKSSLL